MDDLERILCAAQKHGLAVDPEMEAGDLQQLARDLWNLLTDEQRKQFLDQGSVIDWRDFLERWK